MSMSSAPGDDDSAPTGHSWPGSAATSSGFRGMSPELKDLSVGFLRYLQEKGCKVSTQEIYLRAVKLLGSYMQRAGEGRAVRELSVEDLRSFSVHLLGRFAENTVYGHVVGVRQFFIFLEINDVIDVSPARNLVPPPIRPQPARILTTGDLKHLLQACAGDHFLDRRDMALFRVFMATGARPDEVLGLRVDTQGSGDGSLDLDKATVVFQSAYGHERKCPLDPRTINCLKRYLGVRTRHTKTGLPDLWLTRRGRLTRGGLNGIVRSRRRKAGLKDFKLHQIRSTFANHWIAGGGNEGDLMRLLGLADRRMIERYAESVSSATAIRNADAVFRLSRGQNASLHVAPN